MKKSVFKRIAPVLLALLLVFSCIVPAFASGGRNAPVIIIPDMTEIRYFQNPNKLGDTDREVFSLKSDKMTSVLTSILTGLSTSSENPEKGSAQVARAIDEIFANIQMNENGEPLNKNVGVITAGFNRSVADNENEYIYSEDVKAFVDAASSRISSEEIYYFNYDWRLDPTENGALFKTFVDRVKSASGSPKVSVIARGYGGVVANAYAFLSPDHAKSSLASFVLLDSLVLGNSLIGDVMSGRLARSLTDAFEDLGSIFEIGDVLDTMQGKDVGAALARYLGEDPAGIFSGVFGNLLGKDNYSTLIVALILKGAASIIQSEGIFDKIGSGYKEVLTQADKLIYNKGLRNYLRNIPGLWAVVPEEEYRAALAFLFKDGAEPTAALKEKIDNARAVTSRTENTLLSLQSAGVCVSAVAGYNRQILPISASINEQSDGFQATRYAGLGATTGDMDKTVQGIQRCGNANHVHVEPGRALDAATSFLPENTWFIKNHKHCDYAEATTAAFLAWLVFSDTQHTVWENENYPQYLSCAIADKKLSALSDYKPGDEQNFLLGDLDFDGAVTAADARQALRYAVDLDKVSSRVVILIGDVDGDFLITAADARLILRFAVELDKKFPVEG